ncbi:unnamed protein product [Protopolystoma xenopodis]|uniref:Uncharacterized protein n=1 Tax=Protopolystoma xenopodis TaxID=117903 RepID=A0A448WBN9_9PLAT|nr:unnamed protein product [Protopolystoma xenopodis]
MLYFFTFFYSLGFVFPSSLRSLILLPVFPMLRRSLTAFIPRSLIPARNFFISPKHLYYTDGPREPTAPIPDRIPNWTNDLKEIFGKLKNNSNVFLHGGAATPSHLLLSLHKYVMGENLKGIKLFHIHTEGPYPFTEGESAKHFRSSSLFVAKNCRSAINSGIADYTPIYLSEIPHLFRRNLIPLEFALINVSKPDIHGFCSLGPSIDIARAAVQNAKFIVNRHVPFSRGDAGIHISHIDYLVQCDEPLHEMGSSKIYPEDVSIGKIISEKLVSDGATIQMGIGSIPEVVLSQLGGHKHLGVHTEMFSDGLVDLVKAGAVTNALKFNRPGKIVATFVIGSKKVYDFIDNNPLVDMVDVSWVNSPYVIAQNPQPTSINSCIEVDITGQVVSGSIGDKIYSGH